MLRFLLGALVGTVATASYLSQTRGRTGPSRRRPLTEGRVDELSSASRNPEASPLNAGDGTPGRSMPVLQDTGVPPGGMRH